MELFDDDDEVDDTKSIANIARCVRGDLARGEPEWIVRRAAYFGSWCFEPADAQRRREMLSEEPPPTGDPLWDAFMAAMAEWLAVRLDVPVPEWVRNDERYLDPAQWVTWMKKLYDWEYQGTPAEFRAHGVYIHRESLINV